MIPQSDHVRQPLLKTKLTVPQLRTSLVSRPRLLSLLAEGAGSTLTLICAPAGYGKTTLLTTWISSLQRGKDSGDLKVGWLALDNGDNDSIHFLRYLIAALETVDSNLGGEAHSLLQSLPSPPLQTILTVLINNLYDLAAPTWLVIDDYQFITNPAIHDGIEFFLDHMPEFMHLVIATRSDPPLPTARLRARKQLLEIRAEDLRFSWDEIESFLGQVMNLSLSPDDISILENRTEGWIAGLQMAALSMQGKKDISRFIQAFSGSHHYILDYLVGEVLSSQPEYIQDFLLQTSILDHLCGPLCDAVLNQAETVTAHTQARTILEQLEKENLFLISLDDERRWYRYHHLFADLMHARLDQIYPGLAPQLHARAAAWYEQNGSTHEAIHHASLASDFEMIERLIEQNYIEMMNRGEVSWIRLWMGKLSKELVYRRPWLCLYEAFSRSWFGRLEEANLLLSAAEKNMPSDVSAPETRAMLGYHAYVQSRVTAMQGDTRRAIELCLTARENVPANNLGLQIETGITLGFEYFLYGDLVNANKTLDDMIRSCYTVGAVNNPVAAYAILARSLVLQGLLHEAYELIQKAEKLIREAGGHYLGATGLVEVELAALLCEWNDLEAALVRVKQGLDFLPLWGKTDDLCLAYITLSRIQLAQGNLAGAARAIEEAAQLIQSCGVFSEARGAVEAAQVKMWLVQGDWLAVERWAATLDKRFGSHDPFRFEDELAHLTQARVLLAQNKPNESIRLLSRLEESARSGGRPGRLIEIMILSALALQAAGDATQADMALTKSLALAEPGGYLRVFLDEGKPMQMLLSKRLANNGASPMRDYIVRLLAQFDAEPHKGTAALEKALLSGGLVEPLTPRELDVLSLLAKGHSNRQIAEKLILSEGTVKFYVHTIMEKLGVHNRTQAILIARERNLV